MIEDKDFKIAENPFEARWTGIKKDTERRDDKDGKD